jgi:hypothetical protein
MQSSSVAALDVDCRARQQPDRVSGFLQRSERWTIGHVFVNLNRIQMNPIEDCSASNLTVTWAAFNMMIIDWWKTTRS